MNQRRRVMLNGGVASSLCLALLLAFISSVLFHPTQVHAASTSARSGEVKVAHAQSVAIPAGIKVAHAQSATIPGGINVEPSMRPGGYMGANPDSWWDPTNGRNHVDADMSYIQPLGVKVIRVEFPWYLLEPNQKGTYDWSQADYIVGKIRAAGLQVDPILVYTPKWATTPVNFTPSCQTFNNVTSPSNVPAAQDWSDFVTAFVRHEDSVNPGTVAYIDMWNEPDLVKYFNGSASAYANNILIPGYNAVKAVNPSIKVIFAAPYYADTNWIQGVLDAGGKGHFDIASFHNYNGASDISTGANNVQTLLNNNGIGSTPLWLTEYGLQDPNTQDGTHQALMTSVLTTPGPIAMAMWYSLRDDNIYAGVSSPLTLCSTDHYGVRHQDLTAKDSYTTMQQLLKGSSTTSFSTSFESGQPLPTWTNTVDTTSPGGGLSNVGGICCGLTGPEMVPHNEVAHTGSSALLYSGMDTSSSSSYAYLKVFDFSGQNLTVGSSTTLTYWIFPQSPAGNTPGANLTSGNNSSCVAVDLIFSNNTSLRDSGATDQHGNRAHPMYQCGHLTMDAWNQVTVNLGSVANGQTIVRLDVGYDQPANTGGYRGYLDDISISTGGGGGGTTAIDDNTLGSGQNQFQYAGTWGVTTGSSDGRYDGTSHWSNTSGAKATLTFTGTQVDVRTMLSGGGGIVGLSIDGGSETTVDTYSATYQVDHIIWTSPTLSSGTHTLVIRVTGTHNSNSGNAWIDLDRIDVTA